jgi:superfamily I DNA and/or RNA helicase
MLFNDDVRHSLDNNADFVELMVDEASTFPIHKLFTVLSTYSKLRKICLLGDPAQLQPFGNDNGLQVLSVYDIVLRKGLKLHLLDVQRRCPSIIANVLSSVLYESRLRTAHNKIIDDVRACLQWLDVSGVREFNGTSSFNEDKAFAIAELLNSTPAVPTIVLAFHKAQRRRLKSL